MGSPKGQQALKWGMVRMLIQKYLEVPHLWEQGGGRMAEQRGQLSRDDTRLPLPDYFCPAMELTWPTGGVLYAELAGSF